MLFFRKVVTIPRIILAQCLPLTAIIANIYTWLRSILLCVSTHFEPAAHTHTHTISFAFQPIYSVVSIVSNPFVACAAHTILRTYSTSSHSMNGSHWNVNIVVCVCVLPFTHLHIYILFCVSRAFSGMREPSVVLFFGWHCQTTPEHSIKEYTVFLRRFTSLYSHSEEGKSIF